MGKRTNVCVRRRRKKPRVECVCVQRVFHWNHSNHRGMPPASCLLPPQAPSLLAPTLPPLPLFSLYKTTEIHSPPTNLRPTHSTADYFSEYHCCHYRCHYIHHRNHHYTHSIHNYYHHDHRRYLSRPAPRNRASFFLTRSPLSPSTPSLTSLSPVCTDQQRRVLACRFPRRLVWPLPCPSTPFLHFSDPFLTLSTGHAGPHPRAL